MWLEALRDLVSGLVHSRRGYSQFGEDAVLTALFTRLKYEANFTPARRTYVDVGACAPIRHSNSYNLYREGWRGILVEPMPRSPLSFALNRRGDTLVVACVSDQAEDLVLYAWGSGSVFNTTKADLARDVERRLGRAPSKVQIPSVRLDALLARAQTSLEDIGVLFIDVEGGEMEVLRSCELTAAGPYVIVAEVLEDDIARVAKSEVCLFLQARGYQLYAWPNPSVIFLRSDLHARLHDASASSSAPSV